MIYVMTVGIFALILLALVGCAAAWGLSRLMDYANNRAHIAGRFGFVIERIEQEPMSAAVYYGLRWLGICILIGWLFSRAV